jgi:glycosyltransferase involved in cell wall biosynthesis
MSLKVVFFQRKPRNSGNFSIENLFDGIRQSLPASVDSRVIVSKYESNGIWKRLYNILEAACQQGEVNHVTGDVHFLTYLLNKKKTILTIHDCGFMQHPWAIARLILKTFWLTIPVKKSAKITVVSEATKNELLYYTNCKPDKINVVPNFIAPHFKPHPANFNTTKPTLLQMGTAPNKNLDRLIEAIKDLPCRLEIIGKLSDASIAKLNKYKIDYTNAYNLSEEEIVAKYTQCDILTFVSTYEGFGMPIIEANAVGRPVVTSNILSMPEVANDAACLVDPFDSRSIKQGIIRVIQDTHYREQLIRNGYENKKRYDAATVANMYLKIYQEVNLN